MTDLRKEKHRKADMIIRQELLQNLNQCTKLYQAARPRSAESDIILVTAYCSGLSAAHVALEHNCSESTVYRAIDRVQSFVHLWNHSNRWKVLLEHILEQSPNWGECDPEGILDMIYESYREYNRLDDVRTATGFQELYRLLEDLSVREKDPVIHTVCDLCHAHQRTGFTEGIKLGIRLGEELRS